MTPSMLDATVFIDASRAPSPVARSAMRFLREAAREGELWSITPVRTQVFWLAKPEERRVIDTLFRHTFWLDVTAELADRAAAYGARFGRSHRIDTVDALLAAATEHLGARLATHNIRHFPMFPDLQPPY